MKNNERKKAIELIDKLYDLIIFANENKVRYISIDRVLKWMLKNKISNPKIATYHWIEMHAK